MIHIYKSYIILVALILSNGCASELGADNTSNTSNQDTWPITPVLENHCDLALQQVFYSVQDADKKQTTVIGCQSKTVSASAIGTPIASNTDGDYSDWTLTISAPEKCSVQQSEHFGYSFIYPIELKFTDTPRPVSFTTSASALTGNSQSLPPTKKIVDSWPNGNKNRVPYDFDSSVGDNISSINIVFSKLTKAEIDNIVELNKNAAIFENYCSLITTS